MAKAFSLVAVCVAGILFVACGGGSSVTTPTPLPPVATPTPPPPIPSAPREIAVGQVVDGDFSNGNPVPFPCMTKNGWQVPCETFVVTVPKSGMLTARVDYDAIFYDIILVLKMEDTVFEPQAPTWSPVTGRLPVTAGRSYQIAVGLAGNGNADAIGKFKLTTALE